MPASVRYQQDPESDGLRVRLSELSGAAPSASDGARQVQGEALGRGAVDKLLSTWP